MAWISIIFPCTHPLSWQDICALLNPPPPFLSRGNNTPLKAWEESPTLPPPPGIRRENGSPLSREGWLKWCTHKFLPLGGGRGNGTPLSWEDWLIRCTPKFLSPLSVAGEDMVHPWAEKTNWIRALLNPPPPCPGGVRQWQTPELRRRVELVNS